MGAEKEILIANLILLTCLLQIYLFLIKETFTNQSSAELGSTSSSKDLDNAYGQMLNMADELSSGIIKQFPDKL